MKYQLSILMPVYNEIKTVESVLARTLDLPIDNYELIVVDDGSTDGTREKLNEWRKSYKAANHRARNVTLVLHKKNRGKGGGIQSALKVAQGEYFIIQDADLEYDPKEIPGLLDVAVKGNHPVVYGSRFKGKIKGMPKANYVANRLYNFMLFILYFVRMTDMHTCYKLVRTDLLKSLKLESEGFNYAAEVISKLLRRKVPIVEVPITFHGRTQKEGKKIDLKDAWECFIQLLIRRFARNQR